MDLKMKSFTYFAPRRFFAGSLFLRRVPRRTDRLCISRHERFGDKRDSVQGLHRISREVHAKAKKNSRVALVHERSAFGARLRRRRSLGERFGATLVSSLDNFFSDFLKCVLGICHRRQLLTSLGISRVHLRCKPALLSRRSLGERMHRRLARENAFGEREENACAPSSPKATQGEREENACAPSSPKATQGEREEKRRETRRFSRDSVCRRISRRSASFLTPYILVLGSLSVTLKKCH